MLTEHLFSNQQALFEKVAARCKGLLETGLATNGKASFVVPGGTTPAPVFQQLSQQPLDWENIQIAASDERWLAPSHQQSNQKLIQSSLLINLASKASLIAMKNSHSTAAAGEAECNQAYQALHSPIDIVMLGMGTDGHFASLFPGSPQIKSALDLNSTKSCIAIDAEGCEIAGDYTERMSMTLAALTNSKLIILLLTGEQKLEVIKTAKQTKTTTNLPITALLNQTKVDVDIYWAA